MTTMTIGRLRELIQGIPDGYRVVIADGENEACGEFGVFVGPGDDGEGEVTLDLTASNVDCPQG